ncbi:2,4-dihydroxyhept-2-ene-1,7-dioic acid aldolase [Cryptococcus wingfieldii CBS 7118]|uniref:2,4-dihydroxyhept-2-ene-1,7-dioic acid aldolase n=1 Tax=Cryptococcus wingfieldii CBS 7118 TaxID=1295528 RepID=A0A1E3JMA7_9TREE|nr:2,4-dihydroxyhept-2-ene-1,7-dioic acid aldolase [Cryptococcus wingfieldii CBS 7118]ODO01984.1 2,4-dihydroxyhept-2-ene-1,7-dioic acid aldolase [Cryptococcus wingfieldii CBS 7118]
MTAENYPLPSTLPSATPGLSFSTLSGQDLPLCVRQAQILALTGLDGIIIDCEHGHFSDDQMHNSVSAIAALGRCPIIRVRGPQPDLLKRALDTGAHALMVPMINTAEEAAEVVKFSKFPPQGLRGQGLTLPEYMKSANETILTIVQIETSEGVKNVDAIAAVPGVDYVFIGPNDLAMSLLGYTPAKGDEPVFVDAIEKVVAAARKHGQWTGRLVNDGPQAAEALKKYDK